METMTARRAGPTSSWPRPSTGLALVNTQSDRSAGNSDRKVPRTRPGPASPARQVPALQICPASRHPTGRPLQTERDTPPLGYVFGQCTSNSLSKKKEPKGREVTVRITPDPPVLG